CGYRGRSRSCALRMSALHRPRSRTLKTRFSSNLHTLAAAQLCVRQLPSEVAPKPPRVADGRGTRVIVEINENVVVGFPRLLELSSPEPQCGRAIGRRKRQPPLMQS